MEDSYRMVKPRFVPPLEEGFCPAVLANRAFAADLAGDGVPLVIGLERDHGQLARFETRVFPEGHPHARRNIRYVERLVKFLLWQRGGFRLYIGGSPDIGQAIRDIYSPGGERAFDYHFMGEQVYEQTFSVLPCGVSEVPPANELTLSGHSGTGCTSAPLERC